MQCARKKMACVLISVTLASSAAAQEFVQATGDPKIWLLDNSTRRWIPDPPTCIILGCVNRVRIVSPQDLSSITQGADMPRLRQRFVQENGQESIWEVHDGQKHHIPDPCTCTRLGCIGNIQILGPGELNAISTGSPTPHMNCESPPPQQERQQPQHTRSYTLVDNRDEPLYIYLGLYDQSGPGGLIDCHSLQFQKSINKGGQWSVSLPPGKWGEIRLQTQQGDPCDGTHLRSVFGPLRPAYGSEATSAVLNVY